MSYDREVALEQLAKLQQAVNDEVQFLQVRIKEEMLRADAAEAQVVELNALVRKLRRGIVMQEPVGQHDCDGNPTASYDPHVY